MFSIVTPDTGSTVLFDIVDNCEQYGLQNIAANPVVIQQAQTFWICIHYVQSRGSA